ncbi:MAG: nucleotide exchange factor GrpE [Chloroflexi bacterium]|nr:nucleotide exchange factor GrpE [Chloroflexota bacterium]|tara:strand:+ start:442 stop:1014 length:573 start_codon:yes stop_codon:yes gene_type:complete
MPKKSKANSSRESKKTNTENKNSDKENEIEELIKEKDTYYAMAQRSQADLVNYRKRASEEKEEIRKSTNFFLILKILPIIDDFERATSIIPDDSIKSSWGEGLILVQRNFINTLESLDVKKIEAKGKEFDPREHEAILYEESQNISEGLVVNVIREGYKFKDQVIRPAQVTVSKPSEDKKDLKENNKKEE